VKNLVSCAFYSRGGKLGVLRFRRRP